MAYLGKRKYSATAGTGPSGRRLFFSSKRHMAKKTLYRNAPYRPARGQGRRVFPNVKYCDLHITADSSVTSTAGAFGTITGGAWDLADIRDPTKSLGAHIPRYLSTLLGTEDSTAIYRKCWVYGADVEVVCNNAEKAGDVGFAGWITNSQAPTSMPELAERADCGRSPIDPVSKTVVVFKKKFFFPAMNGMKLTEFTSGDHFYCTNTAGPTNGLSFAVYHQAYGAQTSNVNVRISVTFHCKFSELADVQTI